MKHKRVATILFIIASTGCATRPPVILPSPYDDAMYQSYTAPGTATITGSSFLITRGGEVKRGAARQVFLIPDTPFLRVRMKEDDTEHSTFASIGNSKTDPVMIAAAWKHTRMAIGDVDGKFTFTKVPSGGYFIETKLIWQYVNCGFLLGCRLSDTGAVLRQRIDIKDGATTDIQLTSAIPQSR